MAFSGYGELRRPTGLLSGAAGVALVGAGAMLVLAWQMGWWATMAGVTLCAAWIIESAGFFASRAAPPMATAAPAGIDPDPTPLRPLLDQVPVPLLQIDAAGAHAINRAARALFDTDDRILPSVPALIDRSARRLHHEGRRWLPLHQCGGASFAVGLTIDEMAFQAEMVVDVGVNRGELLQRLHLPEAEHRPRSSSEWQVGILHPIVGPATYLLAIAAREFVHRRTVAAQAVVVIASGEPWRLSAFFMKVSAACLSRVLVT